MPPLVHLSDRDVPRAGSAHAATYDGARDASMTPLQHTTSRHLIWPQHTPNPHPSSLSLERHPVHTLLTPCTLCLCSIHATAGARPCTRIHSVVSHHLSTARSLPCPHTHPFLHSLLPLRVTSLRMPFVRNLGFVTNFGLILDTLVLFTCFLFCGSCLLIGISFCSVVLWVFFLWLLFLARLGRTVS